MLKVPPLGATVVKGNSMLYSHVGCPENVGAYISKVDNRSAFATATPPIEENSFITHVGGIALDRFGMGVNPAYLQDTVHYHDLIFMAHDMGQPTTVTTCKCGGTQ